MEENLQYSYLKVLEKYIIMVNEEEDSEIKYVQGLEVVKEEVEYPVKEQRTLVIILIIQKRGSFSHRNSQTYKRKNNIENKNHKKSSIKEKEYNEFVKSVEIELIDLMKRINESENRKIDMEMRLDQIMKENNELKNNKGKEYIYENSAEMNKVKKQLDEKIEEMERTKIEVDKEFKKYLNEIEKLQVNNL